MKIGRPEIVILVSVTVVLICMLVVMVVTMVMAAQHDHAGTIYNQAQHCNDNGLIESNLDWIKETINAFIRHKECEECEQYRTRVASEGIDLAGTETETRVCGTAPRVDLGDSCNANGGRMRAHVQSIRKQGHGAVSKTRRNLDDHHRRSDEYYPKCTTLTGPDLVLPEYMFVLPVMCAFSGHFSSYSACEPNKAGNLPEQY